MEYRKILIIQTAFIGDVVLATPLVQRLYETYPDAKIDFLLRKGNENLLYRDPRLHNILIWNKRNGKNRELFRLIKQIRKEKYDLLVNVQRFASMGFLTMLSGAGKKVGFNKNPFSFAFSKRISHDIDGTTHEVDRNLRLLEGIAEMKTLRPSLHLPDDVVKAVEKFKAQPYLTIAPTSVWFTKQFPPEMWARFIKETQFTGPIYLLGGPDDKVACDDIIKMSGKKNVGNLCGMLTLVESAALMKDAEMNYMNDSAPLHFASAVNGRTTAVFCSTVPGFGFGPLSDDGQIIESDLSLDCRPCGLHGFKSCPKGHFKCAKTIDVRRLEERLIVRK